MKKISALIIFTLLALGLNAQEGAPGESQDRPETVILLERIAAKLDKVYPESEPTRGAPDFGFGGSSFWAVRFVGGMEQMSDFVQSQGSYDRMTSVMAPFANGGGGTWRWVFSRNFQIGANYYGYGDSQLGFKKHNASAQGPQDTVDANTDGLDDYYSYASYGFSAWTFLAQGRIPVVERLLALQVGTQVGFGNDSFTISRNDRQSNMALTGLGIMTGDVGWDRSFLVTGAWLGVDLQLDGDLNVFRLGLQAGYDLHTPMSSWNPGVGVHRLESAPPADFRSSNFWIHFGPQFHY